MPKCSVTITPGNSHIVIIDDSIWPEFQKLIARGLHTWDQAYPDIKELGDLITVGHVQQDYQGQSGISKYIRKSETIVHCTHKTQLKDYRTSQIICNDCGIILNVF